MLRTDGQTVKLLGCKVGDARVRLFSQSDDRRLRTYNFSVLAAPTPTPTPTPEPADTTCLLRDLEGISYPNRSPYQDEITELTVDWTSNCRLFTFWVGKSHVIIDLESNDGLDPTLKLHSGTESLTELAFNDDDIESPHPRPLSARVGRTLQRGFYTVEARLKDGSVPTSTSRVTLTFTTQQALLNTSHQRDHTVAYETASIPDMLRQALTDGIAEWNRLVSGLWPSLLVCESDGRQGPCTRRNSDRQVMLVKESGPEKCGKSVACVIYSPSEHIGALTMHLEDPPTVGTNEEVAWTRTQALHNIVDPSCLNLRCFYLDGTMLHELGHAWGLEGVTGPAPNIMGIQWADAPGVTDFDVKYIKQVYRDHGGESH